MCRSRQNIGRRYALKDEPCRLRYRNELGEDVAFRLILDVLFTDFV